MQAAFWNPGNEVNVSPVGCALKAEVNRVSQPKRAVRPLQGSNAKIEVAVRRLMTKKPPHFCAAVLFGIRRRPTLPDRYQSSTIGTEGLNFCVRYGNRCDPFVITTGNGELFQAGTLRRPFLPLRVPACPALSQGTCLHGIMFRTLTTAQLRFRRFIDLSLCFPIGSRSYLKSSPRPISIIKLHALPHFHR